jgi:hypothetical protein
MRCTAWGSLLAAASLLLIAGCADRSRGASLLECRMTEYLQDPAVQGEATAACMRAKSFEMVAGCTPQPNEDQWDWRVRQFAYNDPQCYRPVGSTAWLATALSPMH